MGRAHAAIVGVGALGCVAADILARAGVGTLTLIDRDVVEESNLQRQSLFTEADAREQRPKAEAAADRVAAINSSVRVRVHAADAHAENVERLLGLAGSGAPAVVIDGTDNFQTRFLVNDVCVKHGLSFAYAGVVGTRATQATFPAGGACLRCVTPEAPAPGAVATCDTAGVFAPAAWIAAAAQAADAIKILAGAERTLSRTLLSFDLWGNERRRVALAGAKDPACPCCGLRRFDFLGARDTEPARLCGQDAVQVAGAEGARLDLASLADRLAPLGAASRTRFMLRFSPADAPGVRLSVFEDGRAIVHGVASPERARSLYARFVGC